MANGRRHSAIHGRRGVGGVERNGCIRSAIEREGCIGRIHSAIDRVGCIGRIRSGIEREGCIGRIHSAIDRIVGALLASEMRARWTRCTFTAAGECDGYGDGYCRGNNETHAASKTFDHRPLLRRPQKARFF